MIFEVEYTETILDSNSKYIEVNISNQDLNGMFTYGNTINIDSPVSDEIAYAKLHLYNCLPIELKSEYTL